MEPPSRAAGGLPPVWAIGHDDDSPDCVQPITLMPEARLEGTDALADASSRSTKSSSALAGA